MFHNSQGTEEMEGPGCDAPFKDKLLVTGFLTPGHTSRVQGLAHHVFTSVNRLNYERRPSPHVPVASLKAHLCLLWEPRLFGRHFMSKVQHTFSL